MRSSERLHLNSWGPRNHIRPGQDHRRWPVSTMELRTRKTVCYRARDSIFNRTRIARVQIRKRWNQMSRIRGGIPLQILFFREVFVKSLKLALARHLWKCLVPQLRSVFHAVRHPLRTNCHLSEYQLQDSRRHDIHFPESVLGGVYSIGLRTGSFHIVRCPTQPTASILHDKPPV
jgi:hypothetical protein